MGRWASDGARGRTLNSAHDRGAELPARPRPCHGGLRKNSCCNTWRKPRPPGRKSCGLQVAQTDRYAKLFPNEKRCRMTLQRRGRGRACAHRTLHGSHHEILRAGPSAVPLSSRWLCFQGLRLFLGIAEARNVEGQPYLETERPTETAGGTNALPNPSLMRPILASVSATLQLGFCSTFPPHHP